MDNEKRGIIGRLFKAPEERVRDAFLFLEAEGKPEVPILDILETSKAIQPPRFFTGEVADAIREVVDGKALDRLEDRGKVTRRTDQVKQTVLFKYRGNQQ